MTGFDFSTFPTLVTPRLILREITPGDAADLFSFTSDPEVQKYDSDPPMCEISEAVSAIEKAGQQFISKKAIAWGIELRQENRLIGSIGFYFWGESYYKTDLGYTVARPYWRQGIATEALRALMQFGFETLHLHRINVDTRMDNLASVRLMQKLGFRQEGVRRECIRNEDGSYQSWGLYGMLEDEYRINYSTSDCLRAPRGC
jgi:[ribosomal protein S5]-alanine N-acetyltransferase